MPSAAAILDNLTHAANHWRWLAVAWHGYLLVVVLLVAAGLLRSLRGVAASLIAPVGSVAAIAWASGNPFTGLVIGALAVGLAASLRSFRGEIVLGSPFQVPGVGLMLVGLAYPHFVRVDTWTEFLWAAPVGLVPCPTLAVVAGATLAASLFSNRVWVWSIAAAALVYGAVGLFRLSVDLDATLLAGAGLLIFARLSLRPALRAG